MIALVSKLMKKSLDTPEETLRFGHGKMQVVHLGDQPVARIVLEPGWRWSEDVKPLAGTESCQTDHLQYVISGRLAIRMDDGTTMEIGPCDTAAIPPGHDAWVVGDNPFMAIDFQGLKDYVKSATAEERWGYSTEQEADL